MKYFRYVIGLVVFAAAGFLVFSALDGQRGFDAGIAQIERATKPLTKLATGLISSDSGSSHSSAGNSTKIEIPGLIKLDLDDDSWGTVIKILVIILGATLGGKLINNITTNKRVDNQQMDPK